MTRSTESKCSSRNAEQEFIAEALRVEASAIERLADMVTRDDNCAESWRKAVDLLEACRGHVVVSGMGKSGLIGSKISATFSSLGQPSNTLHPTDAMHGDLGRVSSSDVVILLSYSGETEEIINLALVLRTDSVPCLGISNTHESLLARYCDVHLSLGELNEACPLNLAPTASTSAQLAIGDALALALARRRNFTADDFHRSHPGGMLGLMLRNITEIIRFRAGETLPVLPDSLTLRDALERAGADAGERRRAGAILLVDDTGHLSGIFTDGDLRRLLLSDPACMDRPVSSSMTSQPKYLHSDALVRDAVRLIQEFRVDEIPVLDETGRPIGLVDVQDLIMMKILKDD